LEFQGVRCDDVSSLEVVGDFCETVTYEFGDFNRLHTGWSATFRQGKYDAHEIESAGAKNNDISSFKVRKISQPSRAATFANNASAVDHSVMGPRSGCAHMGVAGLFLALAVRV
jgi:hypothetical protein